MHPFYYQAPMSIINLLTPTDNENANAWREGCRKYAREKKEKPSASKLPIGSKIRTTIGGKKYLLEKKAPNHQFKTTWWYCADTNTYMPKKRIIEFVVVA